MPPSALFFASRRRAIAVSMVIMALVAYIDWITGPHVSLTLFYLLPVGLIAWYAGKGPGILTAFIAAAIWFGLDILDPGSPRGLGLSLWNTTVRFATFSVLAYFVSLCKGLLGEIGKLVAERTASLEQELRIRKEAEGAIHRLATQLSAAEDAQRRRIAQDIHDTLGENLSLLKIQIQTVINDLPPEAEAAQRFQSAARLLNGTIQQTRNLTFELSPPLLESLGLVPTLEQFAGIFGNQSQIRISVSQAGEPQKLPMALASYLFRATKELVSNAAKHGPATEILIAVRWHREAVRVIVDDDGQGFEVAAALNPGTSHGMGLPWIVERARSFGGQLQVESVAKGGARAILELAIPPDNGASEGSL